MIPNLFILLPASVPTGPVKGAYALANSLASYCKVTIVTIKKGTNAETKLDSKVDLLCISDYANHPWEKLKFYKSLLANSGEPSQVISISMCLSADFFNIFCRKNARTCSSVRANLFANYYHDYGFFGLILAFIHLFILRWIDQVIAMNLVMAKQIQKYSGKKPYIIGNFINEEPIDQQINPNINCGYYRFLFVGSLTVRKQPVLLVKALKEIKDSGNAAYLEYLGVGSEEIKIRKEIKKFNLDRFVKFHGFVKQPNKLMLDADVLVLPSLSEGISRAAMEALYLGIPCVLRDVDGNSELLKDGINGVVFEKDADLSFAMLKAAQLSRKMVIRHCLLPQEFRQEIASMEYMKILGLINGN